MKNLILTTFVTFFGICVVICLLDNQIALGNVSQNDPVIIATTTEKIEEISTTITTTTTTTTATITTTQPEIQAMCVCASKSSDKFHYETCRYAQKILDENLIVFENIDEALEQNFKPCGSCNPQ